MPLSRNQMILLALALVVATILMLKPRPGGQGSAHLAATSGLPRLVDLGATSCIPCRMMAPILDELREPSPTGSMCISSKCGKIRKPESAMPCT